MEQSPFTVLLLQKERPGNSRFLINNSDKLIAVNTPCCSREILINLCPPASSSAKHGPRMKLLLEELSIFRAQSASAHRTESLRNLDVAVIIPGWIFS